MTSDRYIRGIAPANDPRAKRILDAKAAGIGPVDDVVDAAQKALEDAIKAEEEFKRKVEALERHTVAPEAMERLIKSMAHTKSLVEKITIAEEDFDLDPDELAQIQSESGAGDVDNDEDFQ